MPALLAQTAGPRPTAVTEAVVNQPGGVLRGGAVTNAPSAQEAPVAASISIDRQGVTVGEPVRLTVTLRNASDKPVVVQGLRAAVDDAIPDEMELRQGPDEPVALAPGETRSVTYEAVPFASGELKIYGGVATLQVRGPDGKPAAVDLALPDATLRVQSVLTPDWKEKGFRDIDEVRDGRIPDLLLLAALPLAAALILAGHRLLAAKKRYRGLRPSTAGLMDQTTGAVARLESAGDSPSDADFYAEVFRILSTFLADYPYNKPDYRPLPSRQRSATELIRDAASAEVLTSGQLWVARRLAQTSEAIRFGGMRADAEQRRKDLIALRELVLSVDAAAGRTEEAGAPRGAAPGIFSGMAGSGLHFAHPLAFLLFLPFIGYLLWKKFRSKDKPAAHAVAQAGAAPRKKTWRQRLVGFPRLSRIVATALVLAALTGPQLGILRHTQYVPSTDTMGVFDVSGSMNDPFSSGGGGPSKLEAVKAGFSAFILIQQRGTTNRVGLVTFSDQAYLDMALGTDYAAMQAHLKELHTIGSTAIGKGLMLAMSHFLEKNIEDLDDPRDGRIAQLQTMLRDKGLSAALDYIKTQPDLVQKVLRPDRQKIMILLTDGDSNTGVTPQEVAQLIKTLNDQYGFNAHVYTIGAAALDNTPGDFDEPTLQTVAQLTGGEYVRVGDAEHTKAVFEEIGRKLKTQVPISTLEVKDYSTLLAMLAFFVFALGLGLGETKLRTVPAMFLLMTLPFAAGPANLPAQLAPTTAGVVAQVQQSAPSAARLPIKEILPLKGIPQELAEGNDLYARGKFDEAVKKYAEAIARYPDVAELYFNMGNAYLRLGDVERAVASWRKFVSLTQDPKAQSSAFYNEGNAALVQKDAEKALAMYEEALRRDPSNFSAKWNLEVLRELMKQQQQQNNQNQNQSQKHKGKQGQQGQQQGQQGQQKGQQQGQPGQQQGQPGQQQGRPGQQQGQNGGQPGDKDGKNGEKSGLDQLIQKQGQEEKDAKGTADQSVRQGKHIWSIAAPALAYGGAKSLGVGGLLGAGGTALTFSSPIIFWLTLAALPILGGLIAYGITKRLQAARKLSPATAPASFREWRGRRRFLQRSGIALAAAALLGLSAAGPMSGFSDSRQNLGGDKDAVVAFDGSYGPNLAKDGRFATFKAELLEFIRHMQGTDRVGLVVFAKSARTAIPLTIDYGQFISKLPYLERELPGLQEGTDPTAALQQAIEIFTTAQQIEGRQRIVILVSDGVFDDDAMTAQAIKLAQDNHLRIFTIGMDSKNADDNQTFFNPDNLRRIAEATGGAYFPGNGKHTLEDVLARIAQLEKGQSQTMVRAAQPATWWFLAPDAALLFLLLLLPPVPVLAAGRRREGAASAEAKPKGPGNPGKPASGGARRTGAALGAFLLPLSAWPQIFPFAVFFAAAVAFLLIDALAGRALSRGIRWAWQRRNGIVEKGLADDLPSLFDLREVDQSRLAAFLASWEEADDTVKEDLIRAATVDPLWREELSAAYLRGNVQGIQDALHSALAKNQRRTFDSLAPVAAGLLAKREHSSWLDHPDASRRLAQLAAAAFEGRDIPVNARARLLELARHPDGETAETARQVLAAAGIALPAPVPPSRLQSLKRRVALGLSLVLLAANIGGATFSGYQTLEYGRQRAAAEQAALQIFFGNDDYYIFTDKYADARIPEYVLPALRHWYGASAADAEALDRAVRILGESPDPKADNILEILFKRAELLPMAKETEQRLMSALLQRGDDEVWRGMEEQISQGADNPRTVARMERMIALAAQLGTEETFYNLFHFLKSPNEELRARAAQAIYGSLTAEDKIDRFYDRLGAAQGKFAADPAMNLWIDNFVLQRLSGATAPLSASDGPKLRQLLDQLVAVGDTGDAARAAALAAAKPGQEPDLPPSYAEQLVGVLTQALQAASQKDGGMPAPLQYAATYTVNQTVKKLVTDGQSILPDLQARLQAAGVMVKDYPRYRDFYSLQNLRDLRRILDATAQEAAQSQGKLQPAQAEFVLRADAALGAILQLGPASGLPDGDDAAAQAAQALNPDLFAGQSMDGAFFIPQLQKAGLAPNNGISDRDYSFKHSYSAQDLRNIRAFLDSMARSGQGLDEKGAPRPLTWTDRLFLAKTLETLDQVLQKYYPDVPGTSVGRQLGPISSGSPAAAAKADAAARAALRAPGQDAMTLARLYAAAERYPGDARVRAWLARYATEYLLTPGAAGVDPKAAADALEKIFDGKPDDAATRASWAAVREALGGHPGAQRSAAFTSALEDELTVTVRSVIDRAENAFAGLSGKLVQAGLRKSAWEYRDHYKSNEAKELLKILRRTAAEARAQNGGRLKADQSAALAQAESVLARMIGVSAAAGLPAEDPPGEVSASQANDVLDKGYHVFDGSTFLQALRREGFAPQGAATAENEAYYKTYTVQDLQKIRQFLADGLRTGRWIDGDGKPRDLSDNETSYLRDALDDLDKLIQNYGRHVELKSASPAASYTPSRGRDDYDGYPDYLGRPHVRGFRDFPGVWAFAPVGLALGWSGAGANLGAGLAFAGLGSIGLTVLAGSLLIWAAAYALSRWFSPTPRRADGAAGGESEPGAFADGGGASLSGGTGRAAPPEDVLRRYRQISIAARRFADSPAGGNFRSRFIGAGGLEFAEAAQYDGEDRKYIDWKTSAKKDELYVKKFEQEREMPLLLLVKVGPSMGVSTRGQDKRAVVEDIAATLALAASRLNIRVGAALFTDRVEAFFPPKGGERHAQLLVETLLRARPRGRATDLDPALTQTLKSLGSRSKVVLISDLLTEGSGLEAALATLARRHEVDVVRVQDPAETRPMPDVGLVLIRDAESGVERWVDTSDPSYRAQKADEIRRRESAIAAALSAARVAEPLTISTEDDYVDALIAHFSPKQGRRS